MDGINAPSAKELIRFGFTDVNTALANTIEALKNASTEDYTKKGLIKMVECMVNKGTSKIRNEIKLMKMEIVKEAKVHADTVQEQVSKKMKVELALLKKQLKTTMDCIQDMPIRDLDILAIEGNMDMSNQPCQKMH